MNVAFFWVGQDVATPSALVKSLRSIYQNTTKIYQLTDQLTPIVPGVTAALRRNLAPEIMMARLQAYQLVPSGERTLLLDADMLVVGTLGEIDEFPDDLILTSRPTNGFINPNYPEFYPEFVGKTLNDVMPYLFHL